MDILFGSWNFFGWVWGPVTKAHASTLYGLTQI